jgi:hypothetical protein
VSLLHVIFYLKGVLVGKEYFSINHLLFMPYNIDQLPTLLNKKVIPRLGLKEFFMMYIKQFIVYIWMSSLLGKMKTYLRKIVEEIGSKGCKFFNMYQNLVIMSPFYAFFT